MTTKLNGTVNGSVFEINVLEEKCQYGERSYPSSKLIFEYANEHPEIKTFKLVETDIEFASDLAWPTIGTKVTAGNKVINGLDPATRTSNGSGGGSRRAKISASVDGKNLVLSDGEGRATISASNIILPPTATNSFASRVAEVSRKAREGDFELVRTMVGKPVALAKLGDIVAELGETEGITDDLKNKGIAALASKISELGKPELFGKLGTATFELVGGDFDKITEWAKAHLPQPVVNTEPAQAE